ncbi:hybrid sensor histidine kinase/response regulator [Candidatus Methylocalor cossyra]|uniref:histidine kinase n=1 Tax=Candidatus Methylocalor cossyra TaxID=3108543 RepID=A0ABP1C5S2_9GAMM
MKETEAKAAAPRRPGNAEWVVLVAPDPEGRGRQAQALREAGLTVLEAADGAAAQRLIRAVGPVLALVEARLPDQGGGELCRRLKADPATAAVFLLLLSARRDQAEAVRADGWLGPLATPEEVAQHARLLVRLAQAEARVGEMERRFGAALASAEAAARARDTAMREADRLKVDLIAMLSHELRNPLAPIRNAVAVLRSLNLAEPRLQRVGDIIERQVRQLSSLLDGLLDLSRITRGRVVLSRQPLDLAPIVERAVETSWPWMVERRQVLTVTLPPTPVRLVGDAPRLTQVLVNLLANAAQYTPPGGHIWLTVEVGAGHVELRVRDTGVGISAELLPHVFDSFIQGPRSLDRAQGGLGIGLSVVKQLVELHGGTVAAHSDGRERGSEFIVRLPSGQAARPAG